MDDEEFWSEDPKALQDAEWTKISSDFTNVSLVFHFSTFSRDPLVRLDTVRV